MKGERRYEVQVFIPQQLDSAYAIHTNVHRVEVGDSGVCRVWVGDALYIYCDTIEVRVFPGLEEEE